MLSKNMHFQHIIPLRTEVDREGPESFVISSQTYIERGNLGLARQALEDGIRENPNQYELCFNHAVMDAYVGEYQAALKACFVARLYVRV